MFLSRLLDGFTVLLFSASIPGKATIGHGTRVEHRGIGVVINKEASIGQRCSIGVHVVIGGKGAGTHGCPIIGDDVIIGAGAKILGPISVGSGSTIGSNAVVISDVPEGSLAVGVPARILRNG